MVQISHKLNAVNMYTQNLCVCERQLEAYVIYVHTYSVMKALVLKVASTHVS